ncbi:MAG: bifunctional phosphoribosyl-AMP cyclohydrolase/phosphoribosyl-ATP diphosphatase HisIE [Lachnospiraceae bacterium]|mgnify:CR=1 FL=1|nr:bifunctional phosphoribosyl-AMP cyclohydrolase/phosphoribosyl-ATP diphosphatase HisIE [Lachnospiraceae bacterium]
MSYVKLIAGLDHTNALEAATAYSNDGADEIAYMDMSAIEEGREPDVEFMKKIAETAEVPLIVGGGVKRLEDVKKMLYAGAAKVYMKHAARLDIHFVKEMSERFGKDKIGVAIDMNDVDVVSFAVKCEEMGAGSIWLLGFNTGMEQRVREIKEALDVPVMIDVDNASEEQLAKTILDSTVDAVLYTGTTIVNMMQIKHFLSGKNIEVNTFESALDFDTFKLNSDGLIPCIVQDYKTQEVLMMAYMNKESYAKTLETGRMTYYSRSRQKLWMKGEESGHFQFVKELIIDCDKDTILAKVSQIGVACHTGNPTCFFTPLARKEYDNTNPLNVFNEVYNTIVDRKLHPKEGSYTNYLFDKGIDKILKKVGEECTEIVIAAKNPDPEEIKYEISDFLYHCMVLMVERGVTWEDITKELDNRH